MLKEIFEQEVHRLRAKNSIIALAEALGYSTPEHMRVWWEILEREERVLILAARRHGKSRSMSVIYPLYRLLNDPNIRIIIVSETATQAQKWLREITQHIEQNAILQDLKPATPE